MPEASKERVGLPPLGELKKVVLDQLLDPEVGLEEQLRAQLRTQLGLSAPTADPAVTNAPPAAVEAPAPATP